MGYTLAYLVVNLMMQNYLYGSFRWPWISELYEYVQTVHLLPAVVSVVLNPRKPTFKVTAKDESIQESRLSEIGRPFFVVFIVLFIALLVTAYRVYTEPYKADITMVVGGWNLLNLIMAGCALGVVSERGEKAASRRVKVSRRCEFSTGERWYPATIEDVSANGVRIQVYGLAKDDLSVEARTEIRFEPFAGDGAIEILPMAVRNVEVTGDITAVGCRFLPEVARHHSLVADLLFANSRQWSEFQHKRRGNPGLVRGTVWFLWLAFYQMGRGLIYFFRSLGSSRKEARGVR
ncbi:PilZ domain-containing protein [Sinorhizobium medicae]